MSLRLISLLLFFAVAPEASSNDEVKQWLQRMDCQHLLAVYLENKIEHGDRNTTVRIVRELSHVYSIILARGDYEESNELMLRAENLVDSNNAVVTNELRLQLCRARYIILEQILERYRLRISSRDEANEAFEELKNLSESLELLRSKLHKKSKTTSQQLGAATSYLAWIKYYIAWYSEDDLQAKESAQLFAEVLGAEKPDLSLVSFDYRSYDVGARAILGIALCKSIMGSPEGYLPWINELDSLDTSISVQRLVPLWKFYLLIDNKEWKEISQELETYSGENQVLMCRIAAAHAYENMSQINAKIVAEKSMSILIELGQLGIVSNLISKYGDEALSKNGFISNYLEGYIEYQKTKEIFTSDTPPEDSKIVDIFADIAAMFYRALHSADIEMFPSLVNDCQFMLGLSFYYSRQFEKAIAAFQNASESNQNEKAIWMTIVCLDYIESLSLEQLALKEELSEVYINNWPNTKHATELVLYRSASNMLSPEAIEDLLLVPISDPNYDEAQRQASRSLYNMWQSALDVQKVAIGNRYISVALPLMLSDASKAKDLHATEVSSVRALRILEISLHPDVNRIVAARRAIEILDEIQVRQTYSLVKFQNEILYRRVSLNLLENNVERAVSILFEMILLEPEDAWTMRTSATLWSYFISSGTEMPLLLRYAAGKQLLFEIDAHQYGSSSYFDIAFQTGSAAFELYEKDNSEIAPAEDALRISRILVGHKSDIAEVLELSARVEMELGDRALAKERWRILALGSKRGSLQWISAKYNSILLLAEESPEQALEVLNQHQILYPEYGKEPYGSRLQQLHNNLLRGENDGP